MLDELERAGAEHVPFREFRIRLQLRCTVDAVPGRGEVGQHRGVARLELEHDGLRIRRLDRRDVFVGCLADGHHALRRVADALVACLDVGRGHRRAVVELDARLEPEGVGEAVGRYLPGFGQVALHLRIVRLVEFQERVVVRPHRVDEGERGGAVAIIVRRLGADGELEHSAALGLLRLCAGGQPAHGERDSSYRACDC